MNQKGFATLEVIMMIVVIGILATIAVPRFGDMTTKANTAKIQADLATLDNAIEIYFMENGSYPTDESITALSDYVKDVDSLKPPIGKAYLLDGTDFSVSSGTEYKITTPTGESVKRATLDNKTLGKFGKKPST